jgi:hypothetical protein
LRGEKADACHCAMTEDGAAAVIARSVSSEAIRNFVR